jgi:uncharacterized membrane protein YfcA
MSDPLVLIAVGALLALVLGMLGAGGGILAVPAFVALGGPVLVASTMPLVIVGTVAAAALAPHHHRARDAAGTRRCRARQALPALRLDTW